MKESGADADEAQLRLLRRMFENSGGHLELDKGGHQDLTYLLLRLYCDAHKGIAWGAAQLQQLLRPMHSTYCSTDHRLVWHVYVVLRDLGLIDNRCRPQATVRGPGCGPELVRVCIPRRGGKHLEFGQTIASGEIASGGGGGGLGTGMHQKGRDLTGGPRSG